MKQQKVEKSSKNRENLLELNELNETSFSSQMALETLVPESPLMKPSREQEYFDFRQNFTFGQPSFSIQRVSLPIPTALYLETK